MRSLHIHLSIPEEFLPSLTNLPWEHRLEDWHRHKIKFVPVKSGLSRHVVRFVESMGHSFAIKETSSESARKELANYRRLAELEIPTLLPVGVVERDEGALRVVTPVGEQIDLNTTAYLITEVMDKVLPDSYLFRRSFTRKNRNRIWDAVIHLFINLHSAGVYWGDASLANMLIRFTTETIPEMGFRTRLEAILADAETVEIHPSISDSLRLSEIDFFLEAMLWTEADLKASGIVRDPMMTQEDREYILAHYTERFALVQEMRSFELVTQIDVDKMLGMVDVRGYGTLLLKHINEHKWYLSEKGGTEVPLVESARDWYNEVFKPVCRIFTTHGLGTLFPDKTASTLYVEIMEHKYLMSEQRKSDVGLVAALEDYLGKFGKQDLEGLSIPSLVRALTSFFTRLEPPVQNLYLP